MYLDTWVVQWQNTCLIFPRSMVQVDPLLLAIQERKCIQTLGWHSGRILVSSSQGQRFKLSHRYFQFRIENVLDTWWHSGRALVQSSLGLGFTFSQMWERNFNFETFSFVNAPNGFGFIKNRNLIVIRDVRRQSNLDERIRFQTSSLH